RRTKQRQYYRGRLLDAGFDDEGFWPALASVAGPYLAVKDRELITRSGEENDRCAARHDALQAARELFGQERFDRLLYGVVAPTMGYSAATTVRNPAEQLRWAEKGCR